MRQIRVLVVDDSAFMRKMITDILTSDDRIDVIGTARNGKTCLEKIERLAPDVVTLDIEMPVMDGLTTLEKILDRYTLPVVMLSNITNRSADKVVQAMTIGAVDFIEKPSGEISLDIQVIKDEIISKVVHASEAKVRKRSVENRQISALSNPSHHSATAIAIGASTGGPRALQRVLTDLGAKVLPPIFIVQHMPPTFTSSLAKRLNSIVPLHVKEAVHNEVVQNNTVYIAPGDYHMLVYESEGNLAIKLTKTNLVYGHRPAVDVLFNSIATLEKVNKIAIVLTGMGRDGSKGIKKIKKKDPDSITIAEAKESAIINGMPSAAIATNCVDQTVHLHKMGEMISNLLEKNRRL